MTPTTFYQLLTIIALTYILTDPNVLRYLSLIAASVPARVASAQLFLALRFSLWITKRSFQPDLLGRILRQWELRNIRNNPEFAEFFTDRGQLPEE